MKYNPITQKLFTDDNVLIKKLHCPYRVRWNELTSSESSGVRSCNICEKNITDTMLLTDQGVLRLTREDPGVCLKVDLNQENIRVVNCDV